MISKDDDRYFKLVNRFPLRPIKNDEQNSLAAEICDELTDCTVLTVAEQDYLEVLTILISEYESKWNEENYSMSPRELIQYLMIENKLVQKDLISEFGTASRVSEFLKGDRRLSLEQAKKLADRFSLSIAALIEPIKNVQLMESSSPESSDRSRKIFEEALEDLTSPVSAVTWLDDSCEVVLDMNCYSTMQGSPAESFCDSTQNNNVVAFLLRFHQQDSHTAIGATTTISSRRKVEI